MKLHQKIIHEFNVAHGLNCNQQARYHIEKLCNIAENEQIKKWNELGIWLLNNPSASVRNIQGVREILNKGDGVRDIRVVDGKLKNMKRIPTRPGVNGTPLIR